MYTKIKGYPQLWKKHSPTTNLIAYKLGGVATTSFNRGCSAVKKGPIWQHQEAEENRQYEPHAVLRVLVGGGGGGI
jgi:hypothetical protein